MSDLHRSYSPDALSERLHDAPGREIEAAAPGADVEALRIAYLDLLKLCLCDLASASTRTVNWSGDRRLFSRELTAREQAALRIAGRDWPLDALTMVGLRRLDNLQRCIESVVADGVEGDLVEAGAWRGGSSILMRAALDALGAVDRTVWVADSFQGFPAPELDGVQEDRELESDMGGLGFLAPSLEEVRGYFAKFGVEQGVQFVQGFFEDTVDQLRGRRWSVVRLDADTYKATRITIAALYPGLAPGGYLISDDYAFLPACRRAIDEFRSEHGITEPIVQIDFNGACWRREQGDPTWAASSRKRHYANGAQTSRAVVPRTVERIPTDRELELEDQIASLQARLRAIEADLESRRRPPLARPSARRARRNAKRGV